MSDDPAERTDLIHVGQKLYTRCDSIFAPWQDIQPQQCVRVRGHEGHHCDKDGKQWAP